MIRFVCILIIVFCIFPAGSVKACTAFCLQNGRDYYVSKNLDWSIEDGYAFLNEKDICKSILLTEGSSAKEFTWTSKYRSLTLNQFGKGFPLGGINEHGLVVEELNAVPVTIDQHDSAPYLNEFQLIQYLLDNCSSVEEVVEQLSVFQYKPIIQHLHYLVADNTGSILIVEYGGSNFEFHRADETGIPVLSNNNYKESLRYISNFKGFGGDMEVKNRRGSNERFVTIAHGLQCYKDENLIEYSFKLLNLVKQSDTKWSIVYDIRNLSVHFIFHAGTSVKTFDLQSMLSQASLFSLGCDITKSKEEFSTVTTGMNSTLVFDVLNQLSNETGRKVDFKLFRKMAMAGNRHLKESIDKKTFEE